VFIEESDTTDLLKQYSTQKLLAVTPSQTSYFESSRHDGVEGYSESFEILAGTHEENILDLEVVSIYGYVSFMDLLDEVLTPPQILHVLLLITSSLGPWPHSRAYISNENKALP
jgi:hypothetical protein